MQDNDHYQLEKVLIAPRPPVGSDFESILSLIGDAIVITDHTGHIILFNVAAEKLFGYSSTELLGQPIEVLIPTGFQDQHREDHGRFFAAAVATRREMAAGREVQGRRKDGTEFAVEVILSRQLMNGHYIGMAVVRDVSIRIVEEKQRQLIANEVVHRLQNMMAVINSIVSLTAKNSSSVVEFKNALLGRFVAVSRTHEALIHRSSIDTGLREVLESELAPYRSDDRGITLEGPDIAIDQEVAVSLALVFHELATNASKFGALSTQAGRLEVHWLVTVSEKRMLEVIWREIGGPAVVRPTRRGFGSELISKNLRGHGGTVELTYLTEGLSCSLRLPLA